MITFKQNIDLNDVAYFDEKTNRWSVQVEYDEKYYCGIGKSKEEAIKNIRADINFDINLKKLK